MPTYNANLVVSITLEFKAKDEDAATKKSEDIAEFIHGRLIDLNGVIEVDHEVKGVDEVDE